MTGGLNEAAPHYLPLFITPPGETDVLFVIVVCGLVLIVLIIGNLYFRLHALPEKMAHQSQSTQLQLVGIMALLALFTHNNLFWIGALLIAALKLPDYASPLNAIAEAVANLSARGERLELALKRSAQPEPEVPSTEIPDEAIDGAAPDDAGTGGNAPTKEVVEADHPHPHDPKEP